MIAIEHDGRMLEHIENKTIELCQTAVINNGSAIKYIPINLFDPDTYDHLFYLAIYKSKIFTAHAWCIESIDEKFSYMVKKLHIYSQYVEKIKQMHMRNIKKCVKN
jgi:hypothetical protein